VEREGHRLAAEVVARVRQIPGVAGVHLLTAGYEKRVPELLELAGVADSSGPQAIAMDAAAQGTAPAGPAGA
jgi:hypothetical protein